MIRIFWFNYQNKPFSRIEFCVNPWSMLESFFTKVIRRWLPDCFGYWIRYDGAPDGCFPVNWRFFADFKWFLSLKLKSKTFQVSRQETSDELQSRKRLKREATGFPADVTNILGFRSPFTRPWAKTSNFKPSEIRRDLLNYS